ncbi:hypothetical protein AAE02nite_11200 [Adhaeribacter aerolatus]|uniref:Uncharacterized protein n=1 Tax=Adhaeribacter aerolatus TaxID=670289 RepID=A0A512AUR0_9BACT|nr:hypothetical protein [Adhaeribacter aerolatus]GEO03456.1 hypothetical protein AAE02nite_11200 [Adhaeribacter aerolatus]
MVLNSKIFRHIVFYDLNKEHLLEQYRSQFIKFERENFVGDFPTWSAPTATSAFINNKEAAFTVNFA